MDPDTGHDLDDFSTGDEVWDHYHMGPATVVDVLDDKLLLEGPTGEQDTAPPRHLSHSPPDMTNPDRDDEHQRRRETGSDGEDFDGKKLAEKLYSTP